MFIIDRYRVKIQIKKEPGLYTFDPFSATGKSYLCRLCKQYHNYGESAAGYDYYDYLDGRPLPENVQLLVVDRYDLFQVLDEKLILLAQEAIVLVDSKTAPLGDVCQINYKDHGHIIVY